MMKKYWVYTTSMAMIMGCGVSQFANAQAINPFDFAIEQIERPVHAKLPKLAKNVSKTKLSISAASAGIVSAKKNPVKKNSQLKYNKKIPDALEAKRLIAQLTRAYGAPVSVRGQNHVWDIKNPDAGIRQAKIVTIIVNYQPNGVSALIMDRDRGEDGRASWALPRRKIIEKQYSKKPKKGSKQIVLDNPN